MVEEVEHRPQNAVIPVWCLEHHSQGRAPGRGELIGLDAVSNSVPLDQPQAGSSGS